jgi:hypothetical protein
VATSGDHPPHNTDQLSALIKKAFATTPTISVAWTHSAPKAATTDTSAAIARKITDTWTAAHPGTTVLALDQTDTTTVTLTGPAKPTTEDLQSQLRAALPQMNITIQWIPGNILSQSTPTATPTPTATSIPGPR